MTAAQVRLLLAIADAVLYIGSQRSPYSTYAPEIKKELIAAMVAVVNEKTT